jgi:hypothetical protein
VSESERTFDGPIFPITREDTDFAASPSVTRTKNCGSETRGATLARRSRGGGILFTLHNTFEWCPALGEERPSSPTSRSLSCPDLRLSGSTPGSYYLALRLGWVAISLLLCTIVGSGKKVL